jgi:predicted transcriptional regulator
MNGMLGMREGRVDTIASMLHLILTSKKSSRKEMISKLDVHDDVINELVETMISKNLAEYIEGREKNNEAPAIRITERGIKFLELYEAMQLKYLNHASTTR